MPCAGGQGEQCPTRSTPTGGSTAGQAGLYPRAALTRPRPDTGGRGEPQRRAEPAREHPQGAHDRPRAFPHVRDIDDCAMLPKDLEEPRMAPPIVQHRAQHRARHRRAVTALPPVDQELWTRVAQKADRRRPTKHKALPVPRVGRNGDTGASTSEPHSSCASAHLRSQSDIPVPCFLSAP